MRAVSAITITTTSSNSTVRQWLGREMPIMRDEGLAVEISEQKTGQETTFICSCDGVAESAQEILTYYVASALTGAILTKMETDWVKRRVRRLSLGLRKAQQDAIIRRAIELLCQSKVYSDAQPRGRVLLDVMDYLGMYRALHLEGFTRFRLKAYRQQVQQMIEEAVAEWNAEQEQREFIEVLRYFMATQEPAIEQLEVILRQNGTFRLLDENGNAIDNSYLEGFVADLADGGVNNGDLLMSALITLAPRYLRCHSRAELPVLATLRSVFLDRVVFCEGCAICRGYLNEGHRHCMPRRPKSC